MISDSRLLPVPLPLPLPLPLPQPLPLPLPLPLSPPLPLHDTHKHVGQTRCSPTHIPQSR